MLLRIKGFLLWRLLLCGLVVWFYCAVFGVRTSASGLVMRFSACFKKQYVVFFPARLCKQACCRARNKPIVDHQCKKFAELSCLQFKAASKRGQSQARLSYAEREQTREDL